MREIVVVSGGFDPIHSGHIKLIKEAAKYGEVVVLLNSDLWLQKKKGKEFLPFIERTIIQIKPDYIFTHHPEDLNNDHYHTSKACQAAARLYQRRPMKKLKGLYFMEIPSSTDWSFSTPAMNFSPDTFITIGKVGLNKKIRALNAYEGIMRPYPHPRSPESIEGLSIIRGSQAGRKYCESFQTAMNIID